MTVFHCVCSVLEPWIKKSIITQIILGYDAKLFPHGYSSMFISRAPNPINWKLLPQKPKSRPQPQSHHKWGEVSKNIKNKSRKKYTNLECWAKLNCNQSTGSSISSNQLTKYHVLLNELNMTCWHRSYPLIYSKGKSQICTLLLLKIAS